MFIKYPPQIAYNSETLARNTKMPESHPLPDWAYVEQPEASGVIKTIPDDFFVEEVPGFELSGAGQHLYLLIEKSGINTQELVKMLSRRLNIHAKHISYAGLKDRQAVTRQWISLLMPGEIDIAEYQSNTLETRQAIHHLHNHPR